MYLHENKNIFENILGYCSGAQVLSIHVKNQSSKISCYSPFKRRPRKRQLLSLVLEMSFGPPKNHFEISVNHLSIQDKKISLYLTSKIY